MKKIGKLMVFRLSREESAQIEAMAASSSLSSSLDPELTKSDKIREILSRYLGDPNGLNALFQDRIYRALVLNQTLETGDKVKVGVKMTPAMKEALVRLSAQTGSTMEALVNMMIQGYLLSCDHPTPTP